MGFIYAMDVVAVNEACNRMEDCLDAGTRCSNGMCRCWTEQGVAIAQIWVIQVYLIKFHSSEDKLDLET